MPPYSFALFNLYGTIRENPGFYRQFSCNESLISLFNCPLEKKFEDAWSHHNYIVYVVKGRKVWHTAQGSYDLREGSCVFVRKGACIIEQFFEAEFCLVMFFLPDEFIADVLKHNRTRNAGRTAALQPILPIHTSNTIYAFFQSMMVHFESNREPDQSLLELKFRELVLLLADDPANRELNYFFDSILQQPQVVTLQQVMEQNFCFNLKLEEFARLSNRSLSAFKRDFEKIYQTTPGKWLSEKRLQHAFHLLSNQGKTVAEAAFESGFENPSHFSRSFRKQFGVSPASLRST